MGNVRMYVVRVFVACVWAPKRWKVYLEADKNVFYARYVLSLIHWPCVCVCVPSQRRCFCMAWENVLFHFVCYYLFIAFGNVKCLKSFVNDTRGAFECVPRSSGFFLFVLVGVNKREYRNSCSSHNISCFFVGCQFSFLSTACATLAPDDTCNLWWQFVSSH